MSLIEFPHDERSVKDDMSNMKCFFNSIVATF